jgi:hypothetical protein
MRLLWLSVALALFSSGCRSLRPENLTQSVPFSEAEIRTRTWDDLPNHRIGLVSWSTMHTRSGAGVLVVRYGEASTRTASCVDFYEIVSTTASEVSPPTTSFSLLAHRSWPGLSIAELTWVQDGSDALRFWIKVEAPAEMKRRGKTREFVASYARSGKFSMSLIGWGE